MTDFEAFQEALDEAKSTFMTDLTRSMSLVLDQFYEKLNYACVSSLTGEGMDEVMTVLDKCVKEYREEYRPLYEKVMKEKDELALKENQDKLKNLSVKETVAMQVAMEDDDIDLACTQKVHLGGVDEENAEDDLLRNS